MDDEDLTTLPIDQLIERSSLGAPTAVAHRARTPRLLVLMIQHRVGILSRAELFDAVGQLLGGIDTPES